MEGFIASATKFLEWAQMPSVVLAAIACLWGGYLIMLGGDQDRPKAKKWFIGAAVGLVVVNGALALANSVNTNISF